MSARQTANPFIVISNIIDSDEHTHFIIISVRFFFGWAIKFHFFVREVAIILNMHHSVSVPPDGVALNIIFIVIKWRSENRSYSTRIFSAIPFSYSITFILYPTPLMLSLRSGSLSDSDNATCVKGLKACCVCCAHLFFHRHYIVQQQREKFKLDNETIRSALEQKGK